MIKSNTKCRILPAEPLRTTNAHIVNNTVQPEIKDAYIQTQASAYYSVFSTKFANDIVL